MLEHHGFKGGIAEANGTTFVTIEGISDLVIAECDQGQSPEEAFRILVEDYESDLSERVG
jgi:hypothetical protein